jgi:choline-glycine betaine transporter
MLRKNKVRLVALFYSPIILLIIPCFIYLFPKETEYFFKASYAFAFFYIFSFFMPISKWKIGGETVKPEYSYWRWASIIALIQIILLSFFLIQNTVLMTAFINNHHVHFYLNTFKNLLTALWVKNWGLFPWPLIAVTAMYFSYVSYQNTKDATFPFSQHILRQSKSFLGIEVRRIIDLHIQLGSRFFLLLSLILLAVQLTLFTSPSINIFNTLLSILIGSTLLIIHHKSKILRRITESIETKNIRQGIHWIVLFITLIIVLISMIFLAHFNLEHFDNPFKQLLQPLFIIKEPKTFLSLFNIGWWIIGTPLIASLLVKYSRGRTIRQLLIQILLFPLLTLVGIYGGDKFNLLTIALTKLDYWNYIPAAIALLGMIYFLRDKEWHHYSWHGFIPTPMQLKQLKIHRAPPEQIWVLSIAILSILLVVNIVGFALLANIFSISTLIILFLLTAQKFH